MASVAVAAARAACEAAARLSHLLLCLLLLAILSPSLTAAETPDWLRQVFPGADSVGAFAGTPPAAPVYRDGSVVGYVFSTREVIGSVGYAGKPIDILIGLDQNSTVTGAFLKSHEEPILIIGVPEERLADFVAGFNGLAAGEPVRFDSAAERAGLPDAISGATISSEVIRDAVIRSARSVAHARGLLGQAAGAARLDRETFEPAIWADLEADGSLVTLRLARGDVVAALAASAAPDNPLASGDPEDLFIELHAGLATPPRVGENLLGKQIFSRLVSEMGTADQAVLVAGNGLYSFKGTAYRKSGVFERLQLVQGETTIRFTEASYRFQEKVKAEGAPEFREVAVFVLPADSGFDPLRPWRLELLVEREAGGALRQAVFPLPYELPARYRLGGDEALGVDIGGEEVSGWAASLPGTVAGQGQPLWLGLWYKRRFEIVILALLLTTLTTLLVFQDALVRDRRVYRSVRLGFLTVTLVWLGWMAGGQLSVVNVLTFANALLTEFHWEFFLVDPIIFLLWSYVAVALLFWGRGVFCGWLCPFGALQELLNEAARSLRMPQLSVPFAVHERLWPIKYIVFLGLFAVSLHSTNLAVLGAEVEPFKTAIALGFARHWPFVVYVLLLLVAGLFIERFFCRYLCPLGAALAVPARLRMFDWLKRKHQCGRECHICAVRCTVQAIHPSGAINPNECIHCLNCQNLYYDDKTCPPLIARRKRREARAAIVAKASGEETVPGAD